MDPANVPDKFDKNLQLLPVPPEIIAIEVLGEEEAVARGSGMAPFERALVTSYRPSIVTSAQLVSKISNLMYLIHQRHGQTDGQTDRQTLHYSASHGKQTFYHRTSVSMGDKKAELSQR